MPEQVKNILEKIVEWWKKFNNKQRIIILSVVAVVVIALVILAYSVAVPEKVTIYAAKDYAEASEIQAILDADGTIEYELYNDGLVFKVNEEDEAAACLLLGANDYASESYSIDNVVTGSFTTTEADKQKLYQDYLESKFANHISQMSNVESCTVDLTLPKDDGTIISQDEEATAAVVLELSGKMDTDQAYSLAQFISTQLGNSSTEGITILDSDCNVLYSGADADSSIGIASTQLSYTQKLQTLVESGIEDILVESQVFANVEVAMNVDVSWDNTQSVETEYTIPEGMSGGAVTQESLYDYESTTGYTEGTPGTDTNDDTTYVIEDGDGGYTEISESDTTYVYDTLVTTIENQGGEIDYEDSTITVMATKYIVYNQEELEASGQLDDMTWEEFKAANSETRVVEVDDMYIKAIQTATNFPESGITFLCYETPQFVDKVDDGRTIADYAQIIIAVLIFALLGYVVFRSTRSQKVEELEPEISVESLLESTSKVQEELEDIDYTEKSEVRLMIEKFVDENPEAVASLLRNWLNEDWE